MPESSNIYDEALKELDLLITSLNANSDRAWSEADTRVKFIDPLLTKVLGWNEIDNIKREENYVEDEQKRCIDYTISMAEPLLIVEAKKNQIDFEIPIATDLINYSLNGVMTNWSNAWAAVKQVREYCDQKGAKYAMATNGRQFIVFKAISERGHWSKGHALVLASPAALRKHFTLFYECLSRHTIAKEKLTEFSWGSHAIVIRNKPRTVIGTVPSGIRNEFFTICDKEFREVLLDVPEHSTTFLKDCYCDSVDAIKHGTTLNSILIDPLPTFRKPVEEVRPGHRKDTFHTKMGEQLQLQAMNPPLFVVMGGPGVGKTTFLTWYTQEFLPTDVKVKTAFIHCDFRKIECELPQLHDLTIRTVIELLKEDTTELTGSFAQLKEVFRRPIKAALDGELNPFTKNPEEKEKAISGLLVQLQDGAVKHLTALVAYLNKIGRRVVIILDNIDQKEYAFQAKLYQTAQEIVFSCKAVSVIALREASRRVL